MTMIDDIFELILKEASTRNGQDLVAAINAVKNEVTLKIIDIYDNIRLEERRKKRDEN